MSYARPRPSNFPVPQFAFDNATGVITMAASGGGTLCVDAGDTANCSTSPFSTYPYCNPALGPAARAADLASRLTIYDWASLLQNGNNGVPRFGIPAISYNEALHGVVYGCGPTYTDPASGYTSTGCPTRWGVLCAHWASVVGEAFIHPFFFTACVASSSGGGSACVCRVCAQMSWGVGVWVSG